MLFHGHLLFKRILLNSIETSLLPHFFAFQAKLLGRTFYRDSSLRNALSFLLKSKTQLAFDTGAKQVYAERIGKSSIRYASCWWNTSKDFVCPSPLLEGLSPFQWYWDCPYHYPLSSWFTRVLAFPTGQTSRESNFFPLLYLYAVLTLLLLLPLARELLLVTYP